MEMKELFAKRLKEARVELKMTQAKLGKKSGGITTKSISNYENAEKTPSLDSAYRLAEALGVSIDWLCGYEPKTDKDEISVPLALMIVVKKLKPRIESVEISNDRGISNKIAANLIFDDSHYEGITADKIKKYLSEMKNNNGVNNIVSTLIFDNDIYGSIVAEDTKKFLNEYLTIRTAESQRILTDDMIRTLEDELIKKYRHLPDLPDYVFPDSAFKKSKAKAGQDSDKKALT